jgi:membrane-associated phospholipid phosphatase
MILPEIAFISQIYPFDFAFVKGCLVWCKQSCIARQKAYRMPNPAAQTFERTKAIPPAQSRPDSALDVAALTSNCRIIWGVTAAMAAAAVFSFRATNLSFAWETLDIVAVSVVGLMAVSCFFRRIRPASSIGFSTECCAQLMLILSIGCALSYPLATAGFPYRDAVLNAADTWMGLDWRAYLHFFNDRPLLGTLGHLAYSSILLQLLVLIVSLAGPSRLLRLQQYILATALALVITLVVFVFAPASGIFTFLNIQPDEFANLSPIMTTNQILRLDALRNGQQSYVNGMEGLITFPSFHTVWAVLFMWVFYPVKQLRYGAIFLNLFIIASTPILGAHYFIDLVGGGVVAVIAICATARFSRGSRTSTASHKTLGVILDISGMPADRKPGDQGSARSLGGACL